MATTKNGADVTVGDWIRALEDDSIGKVIAIDSDVAQVAWEGEVRTSFRLSEARCEVHATRASAEQARTRDIDAHGIA